MTRPAEPRLPGRLLLRLSRAIVDDETFASFVCPVLADLQQEVRDAGDNGVHRGVARIRGYAAFWILVTLVPFARPLAQNRRSAMTTIVNVRTGGNLLIVLGLLLFVAIWPIFGWFTVAALVLGVVTAAALRVWNTRHPESRAPIDPITAIPASALLVATWPMFGGFVTAVVIVGAVLAVALRTWNSRHPSTLAPVGEFGSQPKAEINMSSVPVAGDIGGLFFVVGAVIIVLLGLPDVRWFVLASVVVGAAMAGGLFAWRSSHTSSLTPANTIQIR
jgi:hypothetical protein